MIGLAACAPLERAIYYAQALAWALKQDDAAQIANYKGELDRACEAALT